MFKLIWRTGCRGGRREMSGSDLLFNYSPYSLQSDLDLKCNIDVWMYE